MGLVVAGSFLVPRLSRRNDPPTRKMMLAVLPFENLSGDPQQEYFADGIAEQVLERLARIPGLKGLSVRFVHKPAIVPVSVNDRPTRLEPYGLLR